MDDFNNFFDDQRNSQPEHTPVYHTPSPKNNKLGPVGILCVVLAVVMSVVVLVNVIVLASLKQTIAEEYAASISADMKEEYINAINEALKDSDIVDEVTSAATQKALEALNSSVGKVANEKSASVARLYMYKDANINPSTTSYSGIASGFLITDTDSSGSTKRYMLTNAHCVRYEATKTQQYYPYGMGRVSYEWASYGTIICMFDGDTSNYYKLEVVAYGAYQGDHLDAESDDPDIALLRIVGKVSGSSTVSGQPSNADHPSLKIASSDVQRGSEVALIGNPEGVGTTNSISVGTVSQTGITISGWGSGKFVMTDAAVNGGNSGGPMIDTLGNVVGIVESKLVDESIDNMGFALSVSTIRNFVNTVSESKNLNLTI